MRLIGKGSAASGLRVFLGIVNIGVVIAMVALIGVIAALVLSPEFAASFGDSTDLTVAGRPLEPGVDKTWFFAGAFMALGFVWLILNRLGRIFASVNLGNAFEAANVRRLQTVGIGLIGLELSSYFVAFAAPLLGGGTDAELQVDLKMWLAILVVFILAEVFRQGSQMRDDAAMTV